MKENEIVYTTYTAIVFYYYLQNYLMKTSHPLIPISCIKEGQESGGFRAALSA